MLRADPATRITIADILKDPWFTKNLSRELQVRCALYLGSPSAHTRHGAVLLIPRRNFSLVDVPLTCEPAGITCAPDRMRTPCIQDGHKGLPCYGATQQPAEEIRHILQQARRPVPQQ